MSYTSKTILQVIIMGFGVIFLLATSAPDRPKPPITGKLIYEKTITLERQIVTNVRTNSIAGSRCYNDTNGTQKDHAFVFDGADDQITVTIADTHGVQPGDSYEYTLFFKKVDGFVKPGAVFRLKMSNPFSSTTPLFKTTWTLLADDSNSLLSIPIGTALGGVYELGSSDRQLSVDLDFQLNTGIQITGACEDYD